jgi:DHA2 family multidrug resistance protein
VDQTQYHRENLVQYVTAYNPQVATRTAAIASNLVAHGFSYDAARRAAVGALDNIVSRQAAMMAYNDAWLLILLIFVIVSPAILLLRRPRGGAGAGAGAGH